MGAAPQRRADRLTWWLAAALAASVTALFGLVAEVGAQSGLGLTAGGAPAAKVDRFAGEQLTLRATWRAAASRAERAS